MITFDEVSFFYQGERKECGVSNLKLHIKKGELVVFCGESGCGKSTVTRLMNGLSPYFYEGKVTGEIRIKGENMKGKNFYDISAFSGSVFQNPRTQFFNIDTNGELVFGCENRGIPIEKIKTNKNESIQRFHLENLMNRSIFQLSGGEQQRIACASAYCTNPDIFVLDEPTSNLDEASIDQLREILYGLKKAGKTIVIAEHRLYFLMDLVDRVFYMENGKITKEFSGDVFRKLPLEMIHAMGLRATQKSKLDKHRIPVFSKKHPFTRESNYDVKGTIEIQKMNICYKEGLGKEKEVLAIENLEIPTGEIVAITGKNGTGKTSLLKIMAGLQKNKVTSIRLNGRKQSEKERRKDSFLVMQDVNHQLFTESVKEEILLGSKKLSKEEEENLIQAFGLQSIQGEHPMAISGGQKQRVAIAAALSSGKRMILLDEPTSGLDYRQMENVAQALKKAIDQVECILVVTHDVEFINSCCTCVLQLDNR